MDRLTEAFRTLELPDAVASRLEASVMAVLEARSGIEAPLPSLTREWLDLLVQRPVANTLLVAAAAVTLLLTTPLAALSFLLLG